MTELLNLLSIVIPTALIAAISSNICSDDFTLINIK